MKRRLLALVCMWIFTVNTPAAVIYSGLQNIAIPFDPEGVYVNVFTNAVSYSYPGDFETSPWINPYYGGANIWTGPRIRPVVHSTMGLGDDRIDNLTYGTVIDALSTFTTGFEGEGLNVSDSHVGIAGSQFQPGTLGYIGYDFQTAPGSPSYFGFMRITIANDGINAFIHDWAYEDISGMAIYTPEPSRMLLLLIGLTGLCLRRRREC